MDIVRALASSPVFAGVEDGRLRALAAGCEPLSFPPGSVLMHQDEEGADLFVVLSGSLEISVASDDGMQHVTSIGTGGIVGEIAGVAGMRRTATVRAASAVEVLRLPSGPLGALMQDHPVVAERVAREAHRRLLDAQLVTGLRMIFGSIAPEAAEALRSSAELVHLPAGATLFAEGEPADSAYLVVLGRIRLSAGDTPIDEIVRGGMLGASALLDQGIRKATAFAVRDSYLARLPRAAVLKAAECDAASALSLARSLIAGITEPRGRRRQNQRIAIAVSAGSDGVDLGAFVERLTRELARFGPALWVSSARADAALGRSDVSQAEEGAPSHVALVRWLHEMEEAHRVLVYLTDPTPSPWTRLALRQADRVLLVVDARDRPPLPALDATMTLLPPGTRPRATLVLLHDAGTTMPSGTAAWLDAIPVDDHLHLREDSPADLARVARTVGGKATAVALSGGGARGFAHIGAIRALEDAGIPIDIVAGSSIGSVMGAFVAKGVPPKDLLGVAGPGFRRLMDYTLPIVSVLKGRRTTRSMQHQFEELQIEDLWLPYFCVTTNITTNEPHFHHRGSLVSAVRASCAIPGVYPPVPIDGDIHIDGGVLNNLPADEMRRRHPDAAIVAIDVVPPVGRAARFDFGLWVSGWRVLLHRLRPGRKHRYPGLADTLVRATVVASTAQRDRMVDQRVADLYVPLDVRGVGPLAFDAPEPIVERGYEQALPVVREWIQARSVTDDAVSRRVVDLSDGTPVSPIGRERPGVRT